MPSVVLQGGKELHELNEDVQKSPVVAASQSVVPHAQFAGLAAVPSMVAHVVKRHRLSSAKQKRPVVLASQSVAPHAQLAVLAAVPFELVQAAKRHRSRD